MQQIEYFPRLSRKFQINIIVLSRSASIFTFLVDQNGKHLIYTGMALPDIYDEYRSNYTIVFIIAPTCNVPNIKF